MAAHKSGIIADSSAGALLTPKRHGPSGFGGAVPLEAACVSVISSSGCRMRGFGFAAQSAAGTGVSLPETDGRNRSEPAAFHFESGNRLLFAIDFDNRSQCPSPVEHRNRCVFDVCAIFALVRDGLTLSKFLYVRVLHACVIVALRHAIE